jgi:hypothetical protein
MTHSAEHVVVKVATPVQVAGVKTSGGIVAAVLFVAGVVVGALLL